MNYYLLPSYFAQGTGYGCDAYGQNAYGSTCATSQQTPSSLQHTGMPILISTGISILLIILAIVIYKKYKK